MRIDSSVLLQQVGILRAQEWHGQGSDRHVTIAGSRDAPVVSWETEGHDEIDARAARSSAASARVSITLYLPGRRPLFFD